MENVSTRKHLQPVLTSNTVQKSLPFIFLYGPPGSGKSTIASKLAHQLNLPCVDLDTLIEQRAGNPIRETFAISGESTFRRLERETLLDALSITPAVVALGGGTLLDPQNRAAVESCGSVVCLSASPDVLLNRLTDQPSIRPLLDVPGGNGANLQARLADLLAARYSHYASFAIQVEASAGSPTTLARQIQSRLGYFYIRGASRSGKNGYPVVIQSGGFSQLVSWLQHLHLHGPIALVADEKVAAIYAGSLLTEFRQSGFESSLITFPAGETHKNFSTVASLYEGFLAAGFDRQSIVIALGGGVTSDLAGFAASTYQRGINWVAVPTTLMAMADASIGGKTGYDLPQGKNLVGSFHSPELVLADPQTLSTLPERELVSGLAEVVKAGLISDPELFSLSAQGLGVVLEHLEEVVRRAIAVKVRIVQADPYERHRRAVLNLGHTLGHALEIASGFTLLHGEAVAIGLVGEAWLSERIGLAKPGLSGVISACLSGLGLPIEIPIELSTQEIIQASLQDKKRHQGELRFSLPIRPGKVHFDVAVENWPNLLQEWRES